MSSKTVKKKALPKGWREVRLGEVGVIHSGGTPSTRDDSNWNGSIFWLTPSEVTKLDQKHISSTERKITQKGLSDTTMLPEGCLIVCTRATIGDCCINTVPMAINQGFKCIQPHEAYSTTFLYYILKSLKQQLVRLSCGNTFGEVSRKDFSNILIAVPSLSEQKAIAALLETWDTAIEKTEALIAAKEKRFKWLIEFSINRSQRVNMWNEYILGDLFDIYTYSSKNREIDKTGEQFIVDMGAVSRNGDLIASKQTKGSQDILEVNDLVMPKDDIGGGNIIGKVAIIEAAGRYVCGDHVYRLVQKKANDAHFLKFLVNCPHVNKQLRARANGTAQLGLSKRDVSKQKVFLPSLHEQKSISRILKITLQEIDALKKIADKYHTQKRGLMQKLLTGKWRVRNVW